MVERQILTRERNIRSLVFCTQNSRIEDDIRMCTYWESWERGYFPDFPIFPTYESIMCLKLEFVRILFDYNQINLQPV